jgi:alpha-beta hydrolase superfamily lysophospholipase
MSLAAFIRAGTETVMPIVPRLHRPDGTKRLVVWCHSAGATAGSEHLEPWLAANNTLPIFDLLGLPIISAKYGGQVWGNDTAQTRVGDAIAYMTGGEFNAKTDKVLLLGVSMGGMLALNWARANPSKVAAIILFYPAVNLQWIHDNGGAATTEAAYGGSLASFNAAVAAHDPLQHTAEYAGVPIQMWYSDADTVVGTANQQAFLAAVSGIESHLLPGAGHADMTAINPSSVAGFAANYL